jgi:hypothetical protein
MYIPFKTLKRGTKLSPCAVSLLGRFIGEGLSGSRVTSSASSSFSSSRACLILSKCVERPKGGVLCSMPGERRGGVAGGPWGEACVGRLKLKGYDPGA